MSVHFLLRDLTVLTKYIKVQNLTTNNYDDFDGTYHDDFY